MPPPVWLEYAASHNQKSYVDTSSDTQRYVIVIYKESGLIRPTFCGLDFLRADFIYRVRSIGYDARVMLLKPGRAVFVNKKSGLTPSFTKWSVTFWFCSHSLWIESPNTPKYFQGPYNVVLSILQNISKMDFAQKSRESKVSIGNTFGIPVARIPL